MNQDSLTSLLMSHSIDLNNTEHKRFSVPLNQNEVPQDELLTNATLVKMMISGEQAM